MREIEELLRLRSVVSVFTDSEEKALSFLESLSEKFPVALIDERRALSDLIKSERAVLVRDPKVDLLEELAQEGFVIVCAYSSRVVDPLKISLRVRPLLFLDWPSQRGLTRLSTSSFFL